jgi:hypothetical protein
MLFYNSSIINSTINNPLNLGRLLLLRYLLNLILFIYSYPSTFLLILISIDPKFLDLLVSLYKDLLILETPKVFKSILLNF